MATMLSWRSLVNNKTSSCLQQIMNARTRHLTNLEHTYFVDDPLL